MLTRRLVLLAAGLVIAGTFAAQAQQAKYVAKIGHLEAATQPRHKGLEKVAALVKERTNGEVEFQLYPASQLGNARQMVEGAQLGSSEGTVMPAAFLGGFNPVVSVLDIPFIMPEDRAKSQALRDGPFGQAILDSFTKRGLVAIAIWPNGRKSVTSAKPLAGVDSFKGQKFRVMDSRILIQQFAGVGAAAIAIPFGELYTALQTGVVDGQENPLDTISTMKYYEVQKDLVVSNHGAMEDLVLFNPAWWNSLPEGHRDVIVKAFLEVRPQVETLKEEVQTLAFNQIKEAGVNVRVLGDAERADWRARMFPPARDAYLERAGAEGKAVMEVYEAEAKKLGLAN
ncbi:TRAP transporter substrate-binding protein [Chelatococcus daeguensis]|uniref:Tripartite ATP-independent periplasmic transporter solute receptor, DctP family n=1 Tax=Chelatococcus sambhunathii TaxID=363953 RepID=A0ABP2A6H7_9HYPH|nr:MULTISPECIES: TRAP transporter substrate-binding protein [Chelatococcus]KZE33663.1 C4-dicarboxylate ABC transporter substrate-binding protein [Chelatococcus daeguensis]MBM3084751.1 TRAP transporter substrate-binding protein [Chelatococcus daeguensis]CUA88070.1 tripartite ATP-independent periplasmic transporter solute receptor, DctP family [Chelatococcus sambhunathii]